MQGQTGPLILIVDDNPQALRLTALLLQKNGYTVAKAANGRDGFQQALERVPDLILLDVVLPDINGMDLCRKIKSEESLAHSFVVLLSGHMISSEYQAKGLEAGADGYLARPVDNKELLARVQAMLRIKKAEDQIRHINNILQSIRAVNQSIIREKDRQTLLKTVCQKLAKTRDFFHVWIALFNPEGQVLEAAQSGLDGKFRQLMDEWDHHSPIHCARLASSQTEPIVVQDPHTSCGGCPLAENYPHSEAVATQLQHNDRLLGLLVIAEPVNSAGKEELFLIKEVARYIAFALENLEQEKERQQIEKAIQQQQTKLEAANQELLIANQKLRETQHKLLNSEAKRRQLAAERLQLLIQIQEQTQRIQQTIDAVPDGVLLLDDSDKIVLANPVAEAHLTELATIQDGEILTHLGNRPLIEFLGRTDDNRHEIIVEPNHHVFEISTQFLGAKSDYDGHVLVIREVTQEREVQRKIQQQERLAAVGQLAAGIAHDFNNILAVIVLYSQMGLSEPNLSDLMRERLATMDVQARRATHLIQQILDFSRRGILERRPLDLGPFLKEQVKLLERTLPENVRIRFSQDGEEHTLNADSTRLQQAIMNLAVNARDAMPNGGQLSFELARIQIEPDQTPPLAEMELCQLHQPLERDWLRLRVSDTGNGIPAEALPHIYEPFFTTKSPGAGSGLGLAQVYGIVKQHQGYIDVQSQEDNGTIFEIYLPALPQMRIDIDSTKKMPFPRGKQELVLVVEDDPLVRAALTSSLEVLNYIPLEAENGQDALGILDDRADDIQLVITDLIMPALGGRALLSSLKEKKPSMKVIVLTGYPLDENLEELRAEGMDDWMEKPVNLRQLAHAVADALFGQD